MKKLIFIFLFLGAIITLFVLFYQSFDRPQQGEVEALRAIPQSAALIFESEESGGLWRDLSQNNLIWEELQVTDMYFRLNVMGLALDSMLTKQPDLRSYLADIPSAISIHPEGGTKFNYLLSMPIDADVSDDNVISALHSLLKVKETATTREYDGITLYSMKPRLFDAPIHVFLKDGLLVISLSELLVEEAVRALQQAASVVFDSDFMKVRKTKGLGARGQLYINHNRFTGILSDYAASEAKNLNLFNQPFAAWSALDFDLKADAASLNGFVLCNDSTDDWLGAFRGLNETEIMLFEYMPSNTAYFVYFGIDRIDKYLGRREEIRELNGSKFKFEKTVEQFNEDCACDMQKLALDWMGSQVAAFIVEPVNENYTQNQYAIFQANEITQAWDDLIELEAIVAEKKDEKSDAAEYRGYEIHQLLVGHYYRDILGQAFNGINNPYFIQMDDMVVMANSVNALRLYIDAIEKRQNLAADKDFQALEDNFSSEAQFLIYSSLARSPYIYQNLLAPEYSTIIEKQTELLRKFEAFIYEVSYFKNDLFYNNVFFKHNPGYEQETNALWEIQLPAEIIGEPHFVKNHYTDALEIVVQDVANRIYLLSNTGKIIWEKALDGPLMGGVSQIDIYKNKKLQMLFSTENSIYLVDRNGAHVESFPVRLPAPANVPVSAVDYDGGRDYRIFIAMEGGSTALFDVQGKRIKEWEFNAGEQLSLPLEHIRIRSKDYIYTISESGKVHLLNRKGKSRHKVDTRLEQRLSRDPYLVLGDKIGKSDLYYVDSLGNSFVLGFDDRFVKLKLTDVEVYDYLVLDLNADGNLDWILLTENHLVGYSSLGDELFKVQVVGANESALQLYDFGNGLKRIGIAQPSESQLLLYNVDGSMHTGFPLYGESPFIIADINRDGNFNLVTAGSEGFVYAYAIEE